MITRGIREFVVGTGGRSHYGFDPPEPNSEVRNSDTYGVLKLTLGAGSYGWQFLPEAGKTFTDSGSGTCQSVDRDADGFVDESDNCPTVENITQVDGDGDHVGDACETPAYGTDPAMTDSDGDGLSNRQEHLLRTNPRLVDSDGNGIPDGFEDTDAVARARTLREIERGGSEKMAEKRCHCVLWNGAIFSSRLWWRWWRTESPSGWNHVHFRRCDGHDSSPRSSDSRSA
jgi:hypothetical protein